MFCQPIVMFSAYHELSPKWAVMANVGWQNWQQFGKVDVGVDSANPQSFTKSLHFRPSTPASGFRAWDSTLPGPGRFSFDFGVPV